MHFNYMFKCLKCGIYFCRSNEDSFLRGIVSEESYNNGNKRRILSLKICFMGGLYELIGVASAALTPTLNDLGLRYLYFPDAIVMFLVIPFIHIMNDEDTKSIIADEGWIQGIRYMFNIRNQVEPIAVVRISQPRAANHR